VTDKSARKITFLTDTARRVAVLVGTALLVAIASSGLISQYFDTGDLQAGEISSRTIRASRDIFVEDSFSTERQRLEAEKSARRIFQFDNPSPAGVRRQLRSFFTTLDSFTNDPGATAGEAVLEPQEMEHLEKTFSLRFTPEEWKVLKARENWMVLESTVSGLVFPILNRGVINDKAPLESILEKSGASLFNRDTMTEQPLLSESAVYDLTEAQQVFESLFPERGFNRGEEFDSVVKKLGLWLLKPNIRFDHERTAERINKARERIEPVFFHIKRGETIVRAGDHIDKIQAGKLRRLKEYQGTKNAWPGAVSYFILSAGVLLIIYLFSTRFLPGFKPGLKELSVLSLTLVGSVVLERLGELVGVALNINYPDIEASSFSLIAPYAAGGILLQTILGPSYVMFFVLCFSLLAGVVVEEFWLKLLLIVLGNLVGTLMIQRSSRRSTFLLAALRVSFVNIIVTLCYLILFPEHGIQSGIAAVCCASVSGILSGIFAAGLLPVAEHIGGYVTSMKLLELASLDRPLLRELSLQAPGTWNHSIIMGQLGEMAAEAIGANSVLTRVGSYYHDIGKAKKPQYFIENQAGGENRHERLTPSMSALIIRSHVKDGIEMARSAKLPEPLIDFISQHHGTALIEFFYDKALKEAEEGDVIDENLFRYPGPKPQTKESGILMLADQVEAISRTMSDPTPSKIQGMVQKVINRVFASGQLDESELTLKDLHLIAKSFSRVLTGIVHRRVEYPEQQQDDKVSNVDEKGGEQRSDARPAPHTAQQSETPLKRLGL
jgi:putative nucleotidyltransferase with HDIG domain